MTSLYLTAIVGHVAQLATVVTVITNTLLIYLTIYQVKQINWAYRILIMIQAEIGVIFSLLECLTRPFMHSYNTYIFYFTSSNVFGASKWLKAVLSLAYASLYQIIFCFMAIQFIYRCVLISGSSRKLKWFKGWKVVYWVGYTAGSSIISIICFIPSLPDPYSISYVKEEMEENYGIPIEDIARFLVFVYGLIFIVCFSSLLLFHFTVIIYCSIQIRAQIKELTAMTSSKTHRLQSQLFLTLILQITAPSIFHHIPVLSMYLVSFLNVKISFPSGIMIAMFSIYPSVDSWILMSSVYSRD